MTGFVRIERCWICEGGQLAPLHEAIFELSLYRDQDPQLAEYTGAHVTMVRCADCGFAQPDRIPTLERFFDRLYDQRWAEEWVAAEHAAEYKDAIFADVLAGLSSRMCDGSRSLLDVGAHAGRFMARARRCGWDAEGIELNPRTAAFAAAASGGRVRHGNVHEFDPGAHRFDAVTLTDVLEHVPEPLMLLRRLRDLLRPGGCVAIKVPNAPAQRFKEGLRARVRRGYRPSLADNLVHVNQFSAGSLRLALARAGFRDVSVCAAAPELPAGPRHARALRLAGFRVARLPGGVHTPLAFNLQAYAARA